MPPPLPDLYFFTGCGFPEACSPSVRQQVGREGPKEASEALQRNKSLKQTCPGDLINDYYYYDLIRFLLFIDCYCLL